MSSTKVAIPGRALSYLNSLALELNHDVEPFEHDGGKKSARRRRRGKRQCTNHHCCRPGGDGQHAEGLGNIPTSECKVGVGGSGKTQWAIQTYREYEEMGLRPLFVVSVHKVLHSKEYAEDGRGYVRTHDGLMKQRAVVVGTLGELFLPDILDGVDVFFIDEGWMIPDVHRALELERVHGKRVVITSITKDFRGLVFQELALTLAHMSQREELLVECVDCGSMDARYDHRKERKKAARGEQLLLVDLSCYEPMCQGCFYRQEGIPTEPGFIRVSDMPDMAIPVDWEPNTLEQYLRVRADGRGIVHAV